MAANNYTHLAANATTQIASAPVKLTNVNINTKGAAANTLTLYDGTAAAGVVIAIIDTTSAVQSLNFDCQCKVGLAAVMATGTAADVTITWG